jgi:hypothetical protein
VLARVVHHPLRRQYALAIVAGLVAEGLLAISLYWQDTGSTALPMLFLLEAVVLGIVFGPGPGMVGACAPVVIWLAAEWGRRAFDIGDEPEDTFGMVLVTVVYLVMVFAFLAGMAGVLRVRWFGPPRV